MNRFVMLQEKASRTKSQKTNKTQILNPKQEIRNPKWNQSQISNFKSSGCNHKQQTINNKLKTPKPASFSNSHIFHISLILQTQLWHMSERKATGLVFNKQNYMWMAIGAVVMIIALLLMAGGKNPDPKVFDYKEVYSTRRITVAPILLMVGLIIEMYAIMRKPKATDK